MKGDWLVILVLSLGFAFGMALAGVDVTLWMLHSIARWLLAWPPPDEHFASMVGTLGWPFAVLVIAGLLRRPITRGAYVLAERMKTDPLKIGGFFEIGAAQTFEALDRTIAATHVDVAEVGEEVDYIESLLEYAGRSEDNALRLFKWIAVRHGPALDSEEFMNDDRFANDRRQAYIDLVEGNR